MKKNSIFDRFTNQLSLLSFSMPSFYLALVLVLVFSIKFELFPIAGLHSVPNDGSLNYYLDFAWHLTLPIFIIVFGGIGSLILYIRALTIEILKSDYIFFASARGLDNKKILKILYFTKLISASYYTFRTFSSWNYWWKCVILETIFSIDGMGLLFYQSALSHDYPVIMGILIIGHFNTNWEYVCRFNFIKIKSKLQWK